MQRGQRQSPGRVLSAGEWGAGLVREGWGGSCVTEAKSGMGEPEHLHQLRPPRRLQMGVDTRPSFLTVLGAARPRSGCWWELPSGLQAASPSLCTWRRGCCLCLSYEGADPSWGPTLLTSCPTSKSYPTGDSSTWILGGTHQYTHVDHTKEFDYHFLNG